MQKIDQEKLAKFVAEYIEEDVAVVFNRLHNEANLLGLVTEAINEYCDRKQIIEKKSILRDIFSEVREACAGSRVFLNDVDSVIRKLGEAKLEIFKLGYGREQDIINELRNKLIASKNMGTRVEIDQVLCAMINKLNGELKDALV